MAGTLRHALDCQYHDIRYANINGSDTPDHPAPIAIQHPVFSTMTMMSHQSWFLPSIATNILWILLFQHVYIPVLSDCKIYLAESSIPNAGLGMYVGNITFNEGDQVTFGDIVIPIVDLEWNNEFTVDYQWLWDEYTWVPSAFEGMEEAEIDSVEPVEIDVASPGVGAAANSFMSLVNIEDIETKISRVVSSDSPGVGAITPYYGRIFSALSKIVPGSEMFVSYGVNYFESRSKTYGYLPMPMDYRRMDKLLAEYKRVDTFIRKGLSGEKLDSLTNDLWDLLQMQSSIWSESRVLNALPAKLTEVDNVMSSGGVGKQHLKSSIRDVVWLEEHGQCLDNIRDGISTNPDAGRGAFANRFIPKDGLVGPAPLIHVPDRAMLNMYRPKASPNGKRVLPDLDGPSTDQLILNYCFSHEESTLLLCPYGLLTSLINHSRYKANAKIVWSKEMRHKEWLEQPIDKWGKELHTGLSIDFVALRDIEEGEEVFIDYGATWQKAWEEHVSNFVPRAHIPAYELNEMTDVEIHTNDERPPEKDGVKLWCRGWYKKLSGVKNVALDSQCRVLKRRDNDKYLVQLIEEKKDKTSQQTIIIDGPILWNVPSDVFYFADMPRELDHHQSSSFRKAMMIPDKLFPNAWKNAKSG